MELLPLYSALTALALTYILIPAIINVARIKKLVDVPNGRSSHSEVTPSLGGVAIFTGMVFSVVFWTPFEDFSGLQYILGAFLIIFLIGVRDDILPLAARKKLVGQILAALVLIFKADLHISSLYGVFGVGDIPYWASVLVTLFTIIVVINSINLIDGINGLAGCLAVVVSALLGTWFYLVGEIGYSVLAFSMVGAALGFLRYNITPAKIFMGDTGSLLVGITLAILAIRFIEYNKILPADHAYHLQSVPALVVSLFVLPLFDTLRVFVKRMRAGRSPFSPDRMHIHHILLDLGMTHMQATGVLIVSTLAFAGLTYAMRYLGTPRLVLLILMLAIVLTASVEHYVRRQKSIAS